MKLLVFCTFGVFFVGVLSAQPTIQWQKAFGGSLYDEPRSILQTVDAGYIVAGYTLSDDGDVVGNYGFNDFWLLKLDSIGEVQWKKAFGGSNHDRAFEIDLTKDGGYILVGLTKSNDGDVSGNHGDYDAWVLKLDSLGGIQWQKCIGGSGWEEAWDVQQTTDGGYIVTGRSGSTDGDLTVNHGLSDFWVVKLNVYGVLVWQKSLGGSGLDIGYAIDQTSDGGYIIAGESQSDDYDVTSNQGNSDYWVVKLNFEGKIEWERSYGGSALDRANDIQQTREGGYIVFGQSASNNGDVTGAHGNYDNWAVKLSASGDIEWQKALGGTNEDFGQSIQQTIDDGYILIGFTSSINGDVVGNNGGKDFWLVKLTETGNLEWQKTLGGTDQERGFSIQQTTDLGYIIAGEAWSNNGDVSGVHGYNDFWIVKLSPESSPTTEVDIQVLQIYPNPATSTITIKIPDEELTLSIQITDLLGQILSHQTVSTNQPIDLSTLPNGLYLLSATTPTGTVFSGKFSKQD